MIAILINTLSMGIEYHEQSRALAPHETSVRRRRDKNVSGAGYHAVTTTSLWSTPPARTFLRVWRWSCPDESLHGQEPEELD
ncbi:unnamed protein product [Gadus morhua 'NCC']